METQVAYAQTPQDSWFRNFIFMKDGHVWVAYVIDKTYFPLNEPEFLSLISMMDKNCLPMMNMNTGYLISLSDFL